MDEFALSSVTRDFERQKVFSKPQNTKILKKEEYLSIVREKRSKFVHEHFGKELAKFFEEMKEEANKMRNCHFEIRIEIPDHFDVYKMEEVLRNYFRDLGYETISEPRKVESSFIVLTLT